LPTGNETTFSVRNQANNHGLEIQDSCETFARDFDYYYFFFAVKFLELLFIANANLERTKSLRVDDNAMSSGGFLNQAAIAALADDFLLSLAVARPEDTASSALYHVSADSNARIESSLSLMNCE
jgi:hypothetical protein